MICRYCETEQRPIKAHIIPAGFFRSIGDPSETLEIHTNKAGARPKSTGRGVRQIHPLSSMRQHFLAVG